MNILDIVILIILLAFIYIGFKKGFMAELIQTIALFAAFMSAAPLGRWLSNILAKSFKINQDLLFFATAIASFLVVLSVIVIAGKLFSAVPAPGAVLSAGNKVSGAAFGLIKGFFVTALFVLVLRITPFSGFITDNIEIQPGKEKDTYNLAMLQEALNKVKNDTIFLSADSAAKNIATDSFNPADSTIMAIDSTALSGKPVTAKTKAKLGYLAYKLSTTMDPALDSYKQYLFSKLDKALETVSPLPVAPADQKK